MRYPLVRRLKKRYPVSQVCQALEVSRSGFYSWWEEPESARAREDRQLTVAICAIFRESGRTYGSPRIRAELSRRGQHCSRKRVARLMRQAGLQARRNKRFRLTTTASARFPVASNQLNRQFSVGATDQVWLGDIKAIWTQEGWLYLAALLDLGSRRIIGWSTSDRVSRQLTLSALDRALHHRNPSPGLLHHSDRGSQYTCNEYREQLENRGLEVSMSRKGNCWDNAPMESFFSTLEFECLEGRRFTNRRQAQRALFQYIEIFYKWASQCFTSVCR